MSRTYMVICAATEVGVEALAQSRGFTVLQPIREFDGITSEDDNSFGIEFGRINTAHGKGYVALCYMEV
ncbi:hypothetical protein [Erythrobacter sp.]|uniref:hypothetical protein n=1 Tax=Erythrobacter sp. TaxID=1042 RepID=UPI00311F286E